MKTNFAKRIGLSLAIALAIGFSLFNEVHAGDVIVICDPGNTFVVYGGKPIPGKLREIIVPPGD